MKQSLRYTSSYHVSLYEPTNTLLRFCSEYAEKAGHEPPNQKHSTLFTYQFLELIHVILKKKTSQIIQAYIIH